MSAITTNIIPLFESYCKQQKVDQVDVTINLCGKKVKLIVNSTKESLAKGYMGEDPPQDDEGMLFVYDDEDVLGFWMKDVEFPLDIIFFDKSGKYINHETMAPYTGESEEDLPRYFSKKPARFAIELKADWCKKNLTKECKLKF